MSVFYVFCRYWTGYSDRFPIDRFNGLQDEQVEAAMSKYARDWLRRNKQAIERSERRFLLESTGQPMGPPIKWRAPTTKGEKPNSVNDPFSDLLSRSGRVARWFKTPGIVSITAPLKAHVVALVNDEGTARDLCTVMQKSFSKHFLHPRFGFWSQEHVSHEKQLDYELEAKSWLDESVSRAHVMQDTRQRVQKLIDRDDFLTKADERDALEWLIGEQVEREQADQHTLCFAIARTDPEARTAWRQINHECSRQVMLHCQDAIENDEHSSLDGTPISRSRVVGIREIAQQYQEKIDVFYQEHCARPNTVPRLGTWVVCRLSSLEKRGRPDNKEARDAFCDAYAFATNLRTADPDLPPLSLTGDDPYAGMTVIRDWCVTVQGARADTSSWWKLTKVAKIFMKHLEIKNLNTAKTRISRAGQQKEIDCQGKGQDLRYRPESVAMFILKSSDPEMEFEETDEKVQALMDQHVIDGW